MTKNADDIAMTILVLSVFVFLAGFLTGMWCNNAAWEEMAVKDGIGEYNSQTKKFQWINK